MDIIKRYKLIDSLELLFGIVGACATSLSIYIVLSDKSLSGYIFWTLIIVGMVTCVVLTKLIKVQNVSIERLKNFSEAAHRINHMVRDEYYRVCVLYEKEELSPEVLIQNLTTIGDKVVNSLSDILTISTGKRVSVCIKYFYSEKGTLRPYDISPDEAKEKEVKTLCRCTQTDTQRQRVTAKIKNNTDLYRITCQGYKDFAITNLPKFHKQLKSVDGEPYRDSNDFWRDFYKTKITVPIRIEKEKVDPNYSGEGFILSGFITADSKSTSTFPDHLITYYTELCKSFADALYYYFDRHFYYWHKLKDRERMGK